MRPEFRIVVWKDMAMIAIHEARHKDKAAALRFIKRDLKQSAAGEVIIAVFEGQDGKFDNKVHCKDWTIP